MSNDTTTTPRYPDCVVQLTGEDGNAFSIAGRVQKALRHHLREQGITGSDATKIIDQFQDEAFGAANFDAFLRVVMSWVDAR